MFDVETERAQNTDRQALFTGIGWRANTDLGHRETQKPKENPPKKTA